jgi:hypothetical protein
LNKESSGVKKIKRNKTRLIAGMLAVSMLILMSSTFTVHAYDYDIFWGYAVTPRGNVWQISTVSPVGTTLFSGKDVDPSTVVATIYHTCPNNPEMHPHTIAPRQVTLTKKLIILVFDKAALPETANYTKVTGTFINGIDSFSAQGPGFVI